MRPNYEDIASLFGLSVPEEAVEIEDADSAEGDELSNLEKAEQCMASEGYEKAVEFYHLAIENSESDAVRAHLGLAGAYDCLDQSDFARRQYEIAAELTEADGDAYIGMSDVLRRDGQINDSMTKIDAAIARQPENPFFYLKRAELLRTAGFPKQATEAIELAIKNAPDQPFYRYWLGDLLLERQEFSAALDAFRAATELSPGDDLLLVKAALAFWGSGQRAEAIKAVRLASDLDPDKNSYYGLLERFLRENGQAEEAALEAKKIDEMDRYDRDMLGRLLAVVSLQP